MAKTVLVVDDSMYMRSLIVDALTQGDQYSIVGQAGDGETAIDLALELKPDIITLDNVLPDMIGLDILRVLKEEEKLQSKIIMVSAVGQESVIQEGLKYGAEDYIVKPFTSESLLEAVNKVAAK